MKDINDNFADALAEELMADMAQNFFGNRRALEENIGCVRENVEKLRELGERVEARVELLHHLLYDRATVTAFYNEIGVEPLGRIEPEKSPAETVFPRPMPVAFTLKGRYTRWVAETYDGLRRLATRYMKGEAQDRGNLCRSEFEPYYGLIRRMTVLLNQEVRRVNANLNPGAILQRVKAFDTEGMERERLVGGGCAYGDECRLNSALAFQPIDFDDFGLPSFPELPPREKVGGILSDICKRILREHPAGAGDRLGRLAERHRRAYPK